MSTSSDTTSTQKLLASLALLVLVVVIVTAAAVSSPKKVLTTKMQVTASESPTPTTTTTTSSSTTATYKDGTYRATGSYYSPGGKESVSVTLTLASDVVTASDVESGANDPTAESYQASFISGYKTYVVGKKITAIKLKNVSGSSLTSQGFNDALKQIESQAKA